MYLPILSSLSSWLIDLLFRSIRYASGLFKTLLNPEIKAYTKDLSYLTQGKNTKMTYIYHPLMGNLQVASYDNNIRSLSTVTVINRTIKMAILYPHEIDVLERFNSINHNLHDNEVLINDAITLQDDETIEILMSNGSYGEFSSNERIPF